MDTQASGIPWQELTDVLRRRRRLIGWILAGGARTAGISATEPAATYEIAADLLNALASNHVARTAHLNQQPDTRRFFEGQRQLLGERLRQAEASLQTFYDREGIDSLPEQRTTRRAQLVELESTLVHSKTE